MTQIDYNSCPIQPWVDEIVYRMHQCHATNTPVLDLSYLNPRGYIPSVILRRPAVRKILSGWQVNNQSSPPSPYPNSVWYAPKARDLNTDPIKPYLEEMARRETEAEAEAKRLGTIPLVDFTNYHPRGGIPPEIMKRIHRREDGEWRVATRALVDRLRGEANKDLAFAKTQEERAEGIESKGESPAKLLASAKELRARAKEAKLQADFWEEELG